MYRADHLRAIAESLSADPARAALLEVLRVRAGPVLDGRVTVPHVKALLSRDGGVCPSDGAALRFDPLRPDAHACPRCGAEFGGERHDRHWARSQHLWLAERACDLAALAALRDDRSARDAAVALLDRYAEVYPSLPNRDNVLGPSHLFFSTYLESMWVTHLMAAACVLREAGQLPDSTGERLSAMADEAAELIGGFSEGLSNRQTWHSAALTAIAAWFGDEELGRLAIEARTGLLGHLTDGFTEEGLWHEGENYHLFAIRGLMLGMQWARTLGAELLEDPELRGHFRDALLAPAATALPDLTYPARGDSRYGVSLAEQPYLELWRIGRVWLGPDAELDGLLAALEQASPSPSPSYDAWLHDAGRMVAGPAGQRPLSWWWALTPPGQPSDVAEALWRPGPVRLAQHGLGVLRHGDTYASLECGPVTSGHGHPDRLHLTLHAAGVHWLPDPGTGSYVTPTLAWYRSALAHNAPELDGRNAGGRGAQCLGFAMEGEWGWIRARAGELTRTVILGPRWLLDVLQLDARAPRRLTLPWHFAGTLSANRAQIDRMKVEGGPFIGGGVALTPDATGLTRVAAEARGSTLHAALLAPGADVLLVRGPGLPGEDQEREFVLLGAETAAALWVSAIAFGSGAPEIAVSDEVIVVREDGRSTEVELSATGVTVRVDGAESHLEGALPELPERTPPAQELGWDARGHAVRVWHTPSVDGTLEGWDCSEPLELGGEHHYRASEEPYDPDFVATAWVNRNPNGLFVAVEVAKPDLILRAPDAPPLALDNEPEDIHADGLQLYLAHRTLQPVAVVVSLNEDGSIRVRPVAGTALSGVEISGAWRRTETGYRVTLDLLSEAIAAIAVGDSLGFDLIVNEMLPGRERRAGQLVWSGGHGWVYLRGDRQDPAHFGRLELG